MFSWSLWWLRKLWNIFALLFRTVFLKVWSVDTLGFPTGSFRGPWSWPHAQVWIIIVCHISSKSCVREKKWFSCHLKCTSALSWDNYSMCSRSVLWILPILMHWLLERCLFKGQGEISGDTKKCSYLIFYEKMC